MINTFVLRFKFLKSGMDSRFFSLLSFSEVLLSMVSLASFTEVSDIICSEKGQSRMDPKINILNFKSFSASLRNLETLVIANF